MSAAANPRQIAFLCHLIGSRPAGAIFGSNLGRSRCPEGALTRPWTYTDWLFSTDTIKNNKQAGR